MSNNLPDFGYLRALSTITALSVAAAITQWETDPPEKEFTNFLDCEVRSTEDRSSKTNIDRATLQDAKDLNLPEFYYSSKSGRYHYRDSGGFVPQPAVDNLTARAIAKKRNEIRDLGEQMLGGKISIADWESATAKQLKDLHTWTYLLGKGGQKNMTQSDYGKLGLRLSYEYGYLRGFAEDIQTKNLSEAQVLARLELYINKSNGSRQLAQQSSSTEAGFRWERRYLRAIENCEDCLRYAAMGWQPIGSLPPPTEKCQCGSNCKCYFKFSRDLSPPLDSIRRR